MVKKYFRLSTEMKVNDAKAIIAVLQACAEQSGHRCVK